MRPQGRTARKKFPDPVWGRIPEIERGISVILVTPQPDAHLRDVTFIDDVEGPDDPILLAIRSVVEVEKSEAPAERFGHYLRWLENGPVLHRRFAAEAVSKDGDLPGDDAHDAAIVHAYAKAIGTETRRVLRTELVAYATQGLIGRLRPQQTAPLVRAGRVVGRTRAGRDSGRRSSTDRDHRRRASSLRDLATAIAMELARRRHEGHRGMVGKRGATVPGFPVW